MPNSAGTISLDLRWVISNGFISAFYYLKDHLVTADAGLIDSEFRAIVETLLVNHSKKTYTARAGDRIAQVVFIEKIDMSLQKVY